MNKNELIQLRNGWLQQASRDLSTRLIDFMEKNRLNEAELADILALDVNQIRGMLNGAQNVTLLEFATLLIATGNVLRIEPVSESPFARGARPAAQPQRGSQRGPQRDANGRFVSSRQRQSAPSRGQQMCPPMPPMGGRMPMGGMMPPMPPMGGQPMPYPMPPMGDLSEQFGGMPGIHPSAPQQQPQPMANAATEFDSMKRSDLVKIVEDNHWNGEIDLENANRVQIIAFLESKNQQQRQQPVAEEQPMPQMEGNVSQMAQAIIAELANNPQMLQQIMGQMSQQR